MSRRWLETRGPAARFWSNARDGAPPAPTCPRRVPRSRTGVAVPWLLLLMLNRFRRTLSIERYYPHIPREFRFLGQIAFHAVAGLIEEYTLQSDCLWLCDRTDKRTVGRNHHVLLNAKFAFIYRHRLIDYRKKQHSWIGVAERQQLEIWRGLHC